MFRQVVMHKWPADSDEAARQGYRDAMERLRDIPEVVSMRFGDDARRFEGNHDFVVVLDYADFDAARRYVEHPLHQAFVEGHARHLATERMVVQHQWGDGGVAGLHHVKLPVSDVSVSADWYVRAFRLERLHEFVEEGALVGVALRHQETHLILALRLDPERARALSGFDALCLAVGTRADLEAVLRELDGLGIAHTEPSPGRGGDAADVPDPDGMIVRLHAWS